jgi:rare lipoprotein A
VKLQVLDRESRAIAEAARRGVDTSGVEIAMNKGRPYPATTKPKPVTPQPPEPASYKTASLQPVKTEPLTGHTKGGHFMPDPVVSQVPVQPTNLFVQAGAFTVRDNAFRYAEQLSRLGNAKVYPVMINGKRFYRVRLGPFDAVRYADAMLEKLVAANYNDAIIVVE